MPQNFEQSNLPGEPLETELLLTAFYAERPPDENRANRLWQQLEPQLKAAPARPRFSGLWFINQFKPGNNKMTETPLIEPVEEAGLLPEPPRRRTLAASVVGGLAMLTVAAGLILAVSLLSGRGPNSGPGVGSQAISNTVAPVPTGLSPTPTPPTYNGQVMVPPTLDPKASPTPPAYDGKPGLTVPNPTNPGIVVPTPTPYAGKSTIPAKTSPDASATPLPVSPKPSSSAETLPTPTPLAPVKIKGSDNVAIKSLEEIPITFNLLALPTVMRNTNPTVSYYAYRAEGSAFLAELHSGMLAAGYKYVSPDGSAAPGPEWQPAGLAAFYTKAGQPDLYLALANLPDPANVEEFRANGFDTGIENYAKVVEDMRAKGYQTTLLVISGQNLLQAMRDGQDPGAGSPPVGTVSPQK
jgi:hypothetical protein